jgi:membrane protease YdiL (CAAX protease family)
VEGQRLKSTKQQAGDTFRVLLFYVSSLIVLMFTSGLTKSLPKPIADLVSVGAAVLLTAGLVLLFTRWSKCRLSDVGLMPGKSTGLRFLLGFLAGFVLAILQAVAVAGSGHHLKLSFVPGFTPSSILAPLTLYFLVACREELVFRSYTLRTLDRTFSSAIAVTVMVIIFVVEHIVAGMPVGMAIIGVGLGGILFSTAALKTKGLSLPLGLHFAWNFGQWIVGFKDTPGIFNAVVDKGYEAQTERLSLTIYILLMLLAITAVVWIYRQPNKR